MQLHCVTKADLARNIGEMKATLQLTRSKLLILQYDYMEVLIILMPLVLGVING